MTAGEWARLVFALGILFAMFLYPIVVLTLDGRKKQRQRDEAEPPPSNALD